MELISNERVTGQYLMSRAHRVQDLWIRTLIFRYTLNISKKFLYLVVALPVRISSILFIRIGDYGNLDGHFHNNQITIEFYF